MDLQTFFIFKNSSHILTIIIIFTTLFHKTPSADSNSWPCVPHNCGHGPDISYPFWIPEEQESYCGSPGFQIICNDNNPVLAISDDDYIIKDIIYSNNLFLLANAEVFDNGTTCTIPLHNFSIDHTPFFYGPAYWDLFFFYNCTSPASAYDTYSVDCASNATHHSFAVFHPELLEYNNYSIQSCQSVVNAPVEADNLTKLLDMNFTGILKEGFVLQWNATNCSLCEKSGGICGSHNEEFACFCNDQPHLRTCDNVTKQNWRLKIGIGFAAAGGSILVMCVIFFFYQRRNQKHGTPSSFVSRNTSSYTSSMTDTEKGSIYFGVQTFSYGELEEATNNFDSNEELGDGGFGTVYKGKLRDGRVVAVKRLYENNYKRVEQFMNEVDILTRLRHQNLVSLYGCTSRHCRELLLVYEYIPNGTVADHLHGERAKPGSLMWSTRISIAIETASALTYLHASDVIHRDVKTNNILLDSSFHVKVADFGLSRLFPLDVTHISTAPQGTPGYVDPEYHSCYQLTDKSDVYSFGVVLAELISSKPAVDITRHRHEINLSNLAINKIQNHELHELVDPCLGFQSDYKVRKMITDVAELVFQCLQSVKEMRPSMEDVLETLQRIESEGCDVKKAEVVDIPADDVVLLKSDSATLSPDSVTKDPDRAEAARKFTKKSPMAEKSKLSKKLIHLIFNPDDT